MRSERGKLLPGLASIARAEQGGVLDTGIHSVRIVERRLQVPRPLELPRVRGPVVPLVGAGHSVVLELVPHRLPGLPTIAGALDHLAEPAAALRGIQPVGIRRRAFEMVDLPASKVGAADLPACPFSVSRQQEGAFARANQYSYAAHVCLLRFGYPPSESPDGETVSTRQNCPVWRPPL